MTVCPACHNKTRLTPCPICNPPTTVTLKEFINTIVEMYNDSINPHTLTPPLTEEFYNSAYAYVAQVFKVNR